ncbi:hypothetical protein ACTQ9L_16120 [Deinococcus wulumuqiensis]
MKNEVLRDIAATDFEFISWTEMQLGIISRFEYIERYRCLEELTGSNSAWDEGSFKEGHEGEEYSFELEKAFDAGYKYEYPWIYPDEPLVMHFTMNTPGMPVRRWDFHLTDADHFPSVPHGHKSDRHDVTLHAYQGFIYEKRRETNRASRASIIALWNNDDFREFAKRALEYFVATHPPGLIGRAPFPLPRKR